MRILIVEDESLIAGFLAHALRAEGYTAHVAADGDEAVAMLDQPWDLVILDLMLPGRDGFSVLDAAGERCPDTPVLVLSARSKVDTKVAAFDAGASDYLSKPFSLDELLARVRARTGPARRSRRSRSVAARGVEIDRIRREVVFIDGRRVELSARELAVFEYLLRCPDEIVSRERLLNEVWQYGFDPRSNVVDVYVGRLRRKLVAAVEIEAVRGAGYRLTLAAEAG
jgi:two-component system, OmpR family, response regulator